MWSQVLDDASSVHQTEIDPITEAYENPFDPRSESTESPVVDSPVGTEYGFAEDIFIKKPEGSDKLFMRARLDTGMEDNAMSKECADQTGIEIMPYTGSDLLAAEGTAHPLGQLEVPLYFENFRAAKTWKVRFIILPDPPFDVAFGRVFISKADLLKRNPEALPLEHRKLKQCELCCIGYFWTNAEYR